MEFYFVRDPDPVDPEGMFQFKGSYYYYKLELDEDGFRISDTCGRMIPFDFSAASELVRTLNAVEMYEDIVESCNEFYATRMDDLSRAFDNSEELMFRPLTNLFMQWPKSR